MNYDSRTLPHRSSRFVNIEKLDVNVNPYRFDQKGFDNEVLTLTHFNQLNVFLLVGFCVIQIVFWTEIVTLLNK